MIPAEVVAFLEQERTLVCATLGPRGWPHLMPLWYVLREPAEGFGAPGPQLWSWTYSASQKVRNLERDPRATVQVEAGELYHELRGVMLECEVALHRDPQTVGTLGHDIFARYAAPRGEPPPSQLPDRGGAGGGPSGRQACSTAVRRAATGHLGPPQARRGLLKFVRGSDSQGATPARRRAGSPGARRCGRRSRRGAARGGRPSPPARSSSCARPCSPQRRPRATPSARAPRSSAAPAGQLLVVDREALLAHLLELRASGLLARDRVRPPRSSFRSASTLRCSSSGRYASRACPLPCSRPAAANPGEAEVDLACPRRKLRARST